MQEKLTFAIKLILGGSIGFILAQLFTLDYPITAGLIVLLSIQNTKKASLEMAFKRVKGSLVAILLSVVMVMVFPNTYWLFPLFLFIFIPLLYLVNTLEALVIGSVLASHVFITYDALLSINALGLLLIGLTVALLMNLYMPDNEKTLLAALDRIDESISQVLKELAYSLEHQSVSIDEEAMFRSLKNDLRHARYLAGIHYANTLFKANNDYLHYSSMRREQLFVLNRMREHVATLNASYAVSLYISGFVYRMSDAITKQTDPSTLINDLVTLKSQFQDFELPKSRIEFEDRARLYLFLHEIEQFLLVKKAYIDQRHKNN